jgi:hypothetical protein
MDKHRRVRIVLGCTAPCAGRVTLHGLGSASFRLSAGTIRTVIMTLSKPAARRVRRSHRLAARLTAADGTTVPVTLTSDH